MGLQPRIAGERFGLSDLIQEGFTQDNLDSVYPPNDTLDPENTPKGCLPGSVAGIYGDLLVGKADDTHRPVGLFLEGASNVGFTGNTAAGSGKLTFYKNGGSYEIDIYETRNASNSDDLVYRAGDSLYTSSRGFLTQEAGPGWMSEELAVVTKAPSAADPVMWIDLRI